MSLDQHHTERYPPRPFRVVPWRGVAKVLGEEMVEHGCCTLTKREMARRAGCGMSTVDRAIREMRDNGMISVEVDRRRVGEGLSRPNVYRITSRAWLDVLRRGDV